MTAASGEPTEVSEDNICKLLGLDIEKAALEIVKQDFKKKRIPWKNASKFINSTTTTGISVLNSSSNQSAPAKQTNNSQSSYNKLLSTPTLKFERNATPETKASASRSHA